jgi:Uma2 family endonuclease
MTSVDQYLRTTFEPNAEFVEGRVVRRAAPFWEHASVQAFLIRILWAPARRLNAFAMPALRLRTAANRFRVPDVCIAATPRRGAMPPPILCVEILSPEDTAVDTMEKVREYLGFGVKWVWVIDPVALSGQVHSRTSVANVEDRIFFTDQLSVDLSNIEF